MKKDVLILSYQNVFDKVACKIIYQNEDIFERGEFIDEEIGVYSKFYPGFYNELDDMTETNGLYIRGTMSKCDDDIFLVTKEDADMIEDKVKAINKKYGEKIRFRPITNGTPYWYIDFENQEIAGTCWCEDGADLNYYETNNCFETQEQAENALERVKKVLADYQDELLKED